MFIFEKKSMCFSLRRFLLILNLLIFMPSLGARVIEQTEKDVEHPIEFLGQAKEIAHWHHERNRQFDPDVTDAFLTCFDDFVTITRKYQEIG